MREIHYKCTTWNKIIINDDSKTKDEIITFLKESNNALDTGFDFLENSEWENITETEEQLFPEENDGQATIELMEETEKRGLVSIWNNSIKN